MTLITAPPVDQEEEEMLLPHYDLPFEGPQPMDVATTESVNTTDTRSVEDPPSARFTWTVDNFTRMNTKKLYSDVFYIGGYKWRVLIFPKGNNVDLLSMYLDVADSTTLPYGWSRDAQFSLAVVNQMHSEFSLKRDTQHQFNAQESDWGFTSFMPLSELYEPSKGYLVNDSIIIEADVAVRKIVDYWSHDSKKETGYVGLKNKGATCYMNSLLQTLYHIPYFRKAVYHMPTTENDIPTGSIPLALQSLFYKLQYSDSSVATKELTKSFGWDTYDSFMQHDVQELNRVLCEKLEDKMKGTVVEGTIQQLFEGYHMNYIECINVDYKSTRKESFYDLQLDVKGCRDVYASFDKYVEVERLEGDNKYHAEQYGLQEAKKGVLFIDFPPVLQLQLKRFEYDFMRHTMVKINDRYEFPLQLDLDRENAKYLSPDADRSIRNLYTLHSVLVHSGGVHGGHYYAYNRPTLSDQWLKFDDERVTKEDIKRALEEQYGGEEELQQTNPGFNNSNAYMLVYIRESDKDKIICNVDEMDIAEHLRIRLKKEQEEKEQKKKEKAEAHLYTVIKVARDDDLVEQIGKDIYFDLVDHDKVRSFRIHKQKPFNVFKEEVAKEFGIPVQLQRFWLWAKRKNHTYRPNRPLTPQEEAQSVGNLREVSNKANSTELKLFLEVEHGQDLKPVPPPTKSKEEILLFFKLYDPVKEELRYVGRNFVKANGKPVDILARLGELGGFNPNDEIELFEEIKFEPNVMCVHIDKRLTFRRSQLEDGDIICFQKSPKSESDEQCRYPDVPSFLEYVHNRLVVRFRSLEKPKEDEFSLELSKLHNYDDVVGRVAQHLGLESLDNPSKIRLTPHNCYSQQPKPQPIKYRGVDNLSDMLVHYNQSSDILYYEVLDIPLPELQGLKTLKVAFHHATKDDVVTHTIRLPKQSTVGDVLNDLKTKVELSNPSAEIRLLEVFTHKIYEIFPLNEKIENINDQYWTLRAEEIPEEEKNLGTNDRLIHVYHFMKDTSQNQVQNFGEPFFLVIHEGETLADVKLRVQKKLLVPDEEFAKWKFAFLSLGRPEYLEDSDIVSCRFQRRDVYDDWEQYLGLEHLDNAPKRSHAANQVIGDTPDDIPDMVISTKGIVDGPPRTDVVELDEVPSYDSLVARVISGGGALTEDNHVIPSPFSHGKGKGLMLNPAATQGMVDGDMSMGESASEEDDDEDGGDEELDQSVVGGSLLELEDPLAAALQILGPHIAGDLERMRRFDAWDRANAVARDEFVKFMRLTSAISDLGVLHNKQDAKIDKLRARIGRYRAVRSVKDAEMEKMRVEIDGLRAERDSALAEKELALGKVEAVSAMISDAEARHAREMVEVASKHVKLRNKALTDYVRTSVQKTNDYARKAYDEGRAGAPFTIPHDLKTRTPTSSAAGSAGSGSTLRP